MFNRYALPTRPNQTEPTRVLATCFTGTKLFAYADEVAKIAPLDLVGKTIAIDEDGTTHYARVTASERTSNNGMQWTLAEPLVLTVQHLPVAIVGLALEAPE